MMITATATPAPIAALRSETNYKRMKRSNRQQIMYFYATPYSVAANENILSN